MLIKPAVLHNAVRTI